MKVTLRSAMGALLLVSPLTALAVYLPTFEPSHFEVPSAFAGTNSGFNWLPHEVMDLGGSPHSFVEWVSEVGNGGESAFVRREGSISDSRVWLHDWTDSTMRSSVGASSWYDFVVNVPAVRLDYYVGLSRLVWWDQSIVRLYDKTTQSILETHEEDGYGYDEIAVTPGHTLELYTAVNQNNLNGYSYPAGNTNFIAEGQVTALPEPMSLAAMAVGLAALARRRKA